MASSSVMAPQATLAARGVTEEEKRETGVVSAANCGRGAFPLVPPQHAERTSFSLAFSENGLPLVFPSYGAASNSISPSLCNSSNILSASMPPMIAPPAGIPFPYAAASSLGRLYPAVSSYSGSQGVSTGTTIVAVTFKDGVVLGADTRTSAGSYVVNRAARKITPIHEKICVCRSGSAADTQALTQIVKLYLQQYAQELPRRSPAAEKRRHEQRVAAAAAKQQREIEQQEKEQKKREAREEEEDKKERKETSLKPKEGDKTGSSADSASGVLMRESEREKEIPEEEDEAFLIEEARAEPRVKAAAMLFQSLCYEYKDTLSAGLIVAGYDPVEGPQIYSIPIGGALMPMKCAAGGSGSVYISAFMDSNYYPNMSKETAVNFVKHSVSHAISRDGASGGMIRVIVVTKYGLEESCVKGDELPVAL